MDHIILGLLLLQSRTVYQLRDRINKGLNFMYSSSMGSIQAAIKKLLGGGYISFEEAVENGKYKKIYSITESGKQLFFHWVNAPIEAQTPKSPELTKLYFMGLSSQENREARIEQHLFYLKGQYEILNAICEEADNIKIDTEYFDIFQYQHMSAIYGRDLMKFNIDWYEGLLQKMRRKEL